MNLLTKWVKKNGTFLDLNDEVATVEHAREQGWLPWDETPDGIEEAREILAERERRAELAVKKAAEAEAPKRTRRSKEQMEADKVAQMQ